MALYSSLVVDKPRSTSLHVRIALKMPVELKHLRYAEAAERLGSFRKAADVLGLKQSNLSRRVRHLEEQLGTPLFERTNAGVKATSAGRDFVDGVRGLLKELQTLVESAKSVGRGEAGRLTIGFYGSLSAGNLRANLVEYGRHYPNVAVNAVENSRSRLFAGIQSGTVDIAIVSGEPGSDGDRSMPLWSERIVIALPEDHPLAANEIVNWTDLKRERFLISERDPGPEIRSIILAKLSSPGALPNVVGHDVSPDNIRNLVGAGFGVSLIYEAGMGTKYAGVVYREAGDGNGSSRIGYRAYWRHGNENPALRNFIRLLEQRYPRAANASAHRDGPS